VDAFVMDRVSVRPADCRKPAAAGAGRGKSPLAKSENALPFRNTTKQSLRDRFRRSITK